LDFSSVVGLFEQAFVLSIFKNKSRMFRIKTFCTQKSIINQFKSKTSFRRCNSMCNNTKNILECDYLVIGAGAAPLAFIDTLLTELPDTKVIMIDKKDRPGGHWVHAYDFVRLHQPSVVYGVSSKQLEGNWLKTMATKFTLPWQHRATKQEILDYFASFVDEKIKNGQLEFYPNCAYDFASEIDDGVHRFSTVDGIAHYEVKVNVKLVNGTAGECIIPSRKCL
jgi:hypothetical protein